MPFTTHDTSSPSASSIFLPLGRRARRDSKSSLANELDQDALNQALNSIHSAASQSGSLTVFNEYTDPPTAPIKAEHKSLATDLQGGLSGLYNKLRASVGAVKDNTDPVEQATNSVAVQERSASRASSGRTSKVQSPRIRAFESPATADAQSHSSKLSSTAPSVSKSLVTSIPSLKSPTATSSSYLADPTLTGINIHATNVATSHSRNGSNLEANDIVQHERTAAQLAEDDSFRSNYSRSVQELQDTNRQDRRLTSPKIGPIPQSSNTTRTSHQRGPSENSAETRSINSNYQSRALSPKPDPSDYDLSRTSSRRQDVPALHTNMSNSAEFGRAESAPLSRNTPATATRATDATLGSPGSVAIDSRPKERLLPRVSQSRLPGFQVSRTSSTDSGLTTTLSRASVPGIVTRMDGINDPTQRTNTPKTLNKLRSKLLDKEFWMRDENAKDCFHCGEPFTTFRRKHHCRTCGQIFDNKCTVLIDGNHFNIGGAVRVCKPCEAIIISHDDDSSDDSVDEFALPESLTRPRTPEPLQPPKTPTRYDDDNISLVSQSLEQMAKTPTLNFPVRRAFDDHLRSSRVLEFDSLDRPLTRPSSSRSLRTAHSLGHGHKRHHSRHQHIRNYKAYHDDGAPFQKRTIEEITRDSKPSAFHRDSVIDPDLAQYLSDDASSGDEQSFNASVQGQRTPRELPDGERTAIGGLLAAVRKGRSRIGDRSIASFLNLNREVEEPSGTTSRGPDGLRPSRKRNLSIASSVHQRLTPKGTKERLQVAFQDDQPTVNGSSPNQSNMRVSRMIRSASMRGLGAPSLELNRASIQHVHKLLQQLLRDVGIPKISSWEEALVPILLRATDDVDPDVQAGDDIDIRNYVKLKKISGGRPGDTAYISGLIFSKNVALKSMPRLIMHPRILIITFAVEYARHEQHFMSLDPVIRQEKEYLENLVGRIAALKPDVLLAQRNISGLALELLEKANIATIFNVKSAVLEAVSRCTQTRVAYSMDKLGSQTGQLGTCESFEVKTFVAEGRKKTYVYLSGCSPELGCTIAIRGADRKVLAKIKRITEFMVYVVYNLKLETCLMRDEWALIPTNPDEKKLNNSGAKTTESNQKHALNPVVFEKPKINEQNETVSQRNSLELSVTELQAVDKYRTFQAPATLERSDSTDIPDDIPVPTFYEDLVEKHETKILSASPFVKFMQPYLLMRARELERRVAYLKRLRDQDSTIAKAMDDKSKSQKFTLISPEMVHSSLAGASRKVREIIHAVHDAEYDKALHNYDTQKKQWEAYLSGNRNLFDPYAHQNIVVLFSQVSTATSVPCSGPDLLAFSFYNEHEHDEEFEADCTLGQYVEDLCYRANDICPSENCEKKMYEHHRQYVHGEAQVTVFVQPYPAKMRGFQDVILMWSQCKICGVETTVTPMSVSTWKYSFGKYLELSFWSSDLHARAGICPHDLHRDHLRYFGYKDFALRVHYDPIDLLEIIVPRMRITWKVDNDLKFRNDVYTKLEHRITRFMVSVKLRLKSINVDALLPENAEPCRAEIERLTKKANEEHAMLIKQLQERYSNSRHWETMPLNRVVRATQEKVAEWDLLFAEFEKNFFPSEKDIRRLATLQLKRIFLDRDVSVTSLLSDNEGTTTPPTEELTDEKTGETNSETDDSSLRKMLSPEKTQSVLESVLEEHSISSQPVIESPDQEKSEKTDIQSLPVVYEGPLPTDEIQHLDLALPASHNLTPIANVGNHAEQVKNSTATPDGQAPAIPSTSLDSDEQILGAPELAKSVSPESQKDSQTWLSPDLRQGHTQGSGTISTQRRGIPGRSASPILFRAHSQPADSTALRLEVSGANQGTLSAINATNGFGSSQGTAVPTTSGSTHDPPSGEKKLSDRLGLRHLKDNKFVKNHSFIPRAISRSGKDSRVSNLAKHFEQLSREFERERIRERKLRAARSRQSRIYPLAAHKPIVEVYRDVEAAVDEKSTSDDMFDMERDPVQEPEEAKEVAEGRVPADPSQNDKRDVQIEDTVADVTETDADMQLSSHAPSEAGDKSDLEEGTDDIHLPESPEDLLRLSQEDLDLKELPKHERTSLMKMLTNFWAERSSSGWASLEYPMTASEHVFADCDVIVREDEPSSIIAFALDSQDYKTMLRDIQDHPTSESVSPKLSDQYDMQSDVMHSLLRKTGTHLKYQFQEGPAQMLCKIFFAEQFDAVRKKCGVADRIVESLSRCLKWDSKGGKTKSLFLKTLDDRFVLKSLSTIETKSFLRFAPNYFQIMSEAFFHELPSVIAKMLGFYQIIIKNPVTNVEYNWFLLVMENLFYDRIPTRIFDLKGSMRNRKVNATGERNEVLLDENMVEFIYESPLFTREHSKKLLRSSVHNDTLFLARQNVMDYSLMVAIDESRKELVVGIIDCIRTYTWDKKLESWIKDRGFAGGGKNRPTVTSPKEYKRRFREAMGRYVLEAPNCWHQFRPVKIEKRVLRIDGEDVKGGDRENELQVMS